MTQPLRNNYGGLLQNYALQQVLKGMGHEVETVDWHTQTVGKLRAWLWTKKEILLSLLLNDRAKPRYDLTREEEKIVSQHTNKFIKTYLTTCPKNVCRKEDFQIVDKQCMYDAYVVGSDQVWRPRYNPYQTAMFLDFVQRANVKRIAYAASFGTSDWEFTQQMTDECSALAKLFDIITVREKNGVDLCRDYLGAAATHVLDPTMLLDKEDYVRLVENEKEPESAGTLFHYILDPSDEKKTLIESVAKEQGLKPFTIMPKCQAENRTKWDVKNRIEDCVFPSVTSWLRGFMDAKMVIVDSFHGAVFSIIFNKPFWVVGNAKRGNARFESLLGVFELEDRLLSSKKITNIDYRKCINWNKINNIRKEEVNECYKLLMDVLVKK